MYKWMALMSLLDNDYYVFTFGRGVISWKLAKQTIIARSTIESEFITLKLVSNEVEWLRNFLANIPLDVKPTPSLSLHCDCQTAITITKNKIFNGKNHHIRLRHEITKQLFKDGIISIDNVKLEVNSVNPLTKPLGKKTNI